MQRVSMLTSLAQTFGRASYPVTRAMSAEPMYQQAGRGAAQARRAGDWDSAGDAAQAGDEQPDRNLPDVTETAEEGKREMPNVHKPSERPNDTGSWVDADDGAFGSVLGNASDQQSGKEGSGGSSVLGSIKETVQSTLGSAKDKAYQAQRSAEIKTGEALESGAEKLDATTDRVKATLSDVRSTVGEKVHQAQRAAEINIGETLETGAEKLNVAEERAKEVYQGAKGTAQNMKESAAGDAEKLKEKAASQGEQAMRDVEEMRDSAKEKLSSMRDNNNGTADQKRS